MYMYVPKFPTLLYDMLLMGHLSTHFQLIAVKIKGED